MVGSAAAFYESPQADPVLAPPERMVPNRPSMAPDTAPMAAVTAESDGTGVQTTAISPALRKPGPGRRRVAPHAPPWWTARLSTPSRAARPAGDSSRPAHEDSACRGRKRTAGVWSSVNCPDPGGLPATSPRLRANRRKPAVTSDDRAGVRHGSPNGSRNENSCRVQRRPRPDGAQRVGRHGAACAAWHCCEPHSGRRHGCIPSVGPEGGETRRSRTGCQAVNISPTAPNHRRYCLLEVSFRLRAAPPGLTCVGMFDHLVTGGAVRQFANGIDHGFQSAAGCHVLEKGVDITISGRKPSLATTVESSRTSAALRLTAGTKDRAGCHRVQAAGHPFRL